MFVNRHRHRDGEAGFTLVELLVVMSILLVLGGMVITVITTGTSAARVTSDRVTALQELQLAMQRVVRDLRVADALVLSEEDDFHNEITASITREDSGPSEVRFLVEEIAAGEEQAGRKRLIREDTGFALIARLDNVDEDGQPVPVFTYLDRLGRTIDCNGPQECAERYTTASQIRIRFVREIPGREPVRAETTLSIRSVRYTGGGS